MVAWDGILLEAPPLRALEVVTRPEHRTMLFFTAADKYKAPIRQLFGGIDKLRVNLIKDIIWYSFMRMCIRVL